MPQARKVIYSRQLHDAKDDITRIRVAHASNESVVAGSDVLVRWSCDLPPHLRMAIAFMIKLSAAKRTIGDLNWRQQK